MKRTPGKRKRPTAKAASKRRPVAGHLLVVECQAEKLAGQGLSFGTGIVPVLKAMFPGKRIVLVETSAEAELLRSLADISDEHGRFRSILVVGHSNVAGLRLTNDRGLAWSAVGQWLARFEPEFLLFAACEAGRSEAVRDLFKPIPSLREVYASPIKLYHDQSAPLVVLIMELLQHRRIDTETSVLVRALNFVVTGGQLYRWRRSETGQGEELKGLLWDSLAALFDRRR